MSSLTSGITLLAYRSRITVSLTREMTFSSYASAGSLGFASRANALKHISCPPSPAVITTQEPQPDGANSKRAAGTGDAYCSSARPASQSTRLLQQHTTSKSKHAPKRWQRHLPALRPSFRKEAAGSLPPRARTRIHTRHVPTDVRARLQRRSSSTWVRTGMPSLVGVLLFISQSHASAACGIGCFPFASAAHRPPPRNATYAHTHPCRGVRTCQRRGGSPLRPSTLRAQPQRAMPPRTAKDRRASPFSTAQHRRGAAPAGYTAEAYQCA